MSNQKKYNDFPIPLESIQSYPQIQQKVSIKTLQKPLFRQHAFCNVV